MSSELIQHYNTSLMHECLNKRPQVLSLCTQVLRPEADIILYPSGMPLLFTNLQHSIHICKISSQQSFKERNAG